jgi:catechol 2,3-dioxygenase-like lactoylglutathione lyase family enzyme
MIQSLYSVAIFVHNIERAVEFYRDVLGLPLRAQGTFGAEFLEGATRLSVHPAVHPDSKALVGRHTGLTFTVDGLLHFCGDLHAKGVRFLNEPTQQAWGIMAMITDPDGNVMALWDGGGADGGEAKPDRGGPTPGDPGKTPA